MANEVRLSRRRFLIGTGGVVGGGLLGVARLPSTALAAGAEDFGPLEAPDAQGLRLPAGFSSRVIAVSGERVGATRHVWHAAPDGGATFATPQSGWIYVCNSEAGAGAGGVGAIRFSSDGEIIDAYSILSGTTRNCAGGPTPWNTWLSCEEIASGRAWECDPFAPGSQGRVREALGVFNHEAAAVDPVHEKIYLTEDERDGLLYRFTPTVYPDLSLGRLEAAKIEDPGRSGSIRPGETRTLSWHAIPDPSAATGPTRFQAPEATAFRGGEGCWYHAGEVVFSTKNDNRVWRLDTNTDRLQIIYDYATAPIRPLSGVDNVYVAPTGDIYVAEDGGDLEIVALTVSGQVKPILQLTGRIGTEITGPALSPDGTRLYFNSQRNPGTTYEVKGPFLARTARSRGARSNILRSG